MDYNLVEKCSSPQAAQIAMKQFFKTIQGIKRVPGAHKSRAAVGRLGTALTDVAKYPQSQTAVQPLLKRTFGDQRSDEIMRRYGFDAAIAAPQRAVGVKATQTTLRGVDPATGRWIGSSVQKPDSVIGSVREHLRSAGEFAAKGRKHYGQA